MSKTFRRSFRSQALKQSALKVAHVLSLTALVFNMSGLLLILPTRATAATVDATIDEEGGSGSAALSVPAPVTNADTGYLNPTSNVNLAATVTNPANAYTQNDTDASINGTGDHKYGTFNIPDLTGKVVTGIEVKVRGQRTSGSGNKTLNIYISDNNGSSWGTGKDSGNFAGGYDTFTPGDDSDLWLRADWTPSELSNANFAVRIENDFSSGTVGVDHVAVKVYYQDAPAEPAPNPALPTSCGLDMGLVIDSSGSIDSTELGQMKTAYKDFVDAFLPGTPTQMSVVEFDSTVIPPSLGFTSDISDIKDDIDAAVSGGRTNWEGALLESHGLYDPRPAKPDLMVFASDGNPNAINGDSTVSEAEAVNAAVIAANAIKADGIRVLALGIGNDLDLDNLKAISGPNVNIGVNSDVITSNFDDLATDLAKLADELCGGKILVQKQFDTDGDGQVDIDGSVPNPLLADWSFDVNGSPSDPSAQVTTNTGSLEFDVLNGTYSVVEDVMTNTVLANAWCVNGQTPVGTVDLPNRTITGLVMDTDETISCFFVNKYATGTLRVIKHVVGGTASADDWSLHVKQQGSDVPNSPQPGDESGTDYQLTPGSYQVSETDGPDGYTATFSESCIENGWITVPAGQTVTCTITNTRDTGSVVVHKLVKTDRVFEDGDGDGSPFRWGLDAADPTRLMGSGVDNVPTGSHQVTENTVPGYHVAGWFPLDGFKYDCEQPPYTDLPANIQVNDDAVTTIVICNEIDAGSVKVHKMVNNGHGYSNADGDGSPFRWGLDAEDPTRLMGSTADNVPAGAHGVTENSVPGYHFVGWYYGGQDTQYSCYEPYSTDLPAAITVVDGQTTTIVICNQVDRGSIDGSKWQDNHDGLWEKGEPTLPGWTIFIDLNGNGQLDNTCLLAGVDCEPWTVTDQDGNYAFTSLVPGEYRVCEVMQQYWTQTYPGEATQWCHTVNVGAGQAVSHVNFGNQINEPKGIIRGYKWSDINGNHERDCYDALQGDEENCEPLLAEWHIFIDTNGNGAWDADERDTWTDGSGWYEFDMLFAGDYKVCEVQQEGYIQTFPGEDGCWYIHIDSNNVIVENAHFGNMPIKHFIHGSKWHDRNGDSGWQPGEEMLGNWQIQLYNDDTDTWLADAYTGNVPGDSYGWYSFDNLTVGNYMVCEVQQSGWTRTRPMTEDGCYHITLTNAVPHRVFLTAHFANQAYPDVWVEKSITTQEEIVESDGPYQLAINYGNNGAMTATDVLICDPLAGYWEMPPLAINGGESNGFDTDGSVCGTPNSIWWNVGDLDWNETGQVTATLNASTDPGDYPGIGNQQCNLENAASITVEGEGWIDSNTENNRSFAVREHACPTIPEFHLTVSKTDNQETTVPGATYSYTIDWSLTSFYEVPNAVITDTLPANVDFVSASSNGGPSNYDAGSRTVTWTLGDLNPTGPTYMLSGSETVTVTVDTPLENGTALLNTGWFCYGDSRDEGFQGEEPCEPFDDTTTVVSDYTLSIDKTDSADPVHPGDPLTYTVDWEITGNAPAFDVVLTDPLPGELDFVAASDGGVYDSGTHTVTWTIGDVLVLPASGSFTVDTTVHADVPNETSVFNESTIEATTCQVIFTASIAGDTSSCVPETETATADETTLVTVEELAEPGLTLTKSVDTDATLSPGDTVSYTVKITNSGNVPLTNVTLNDLLEDGLFFAVSPFGTAKALISGGTLAIGESATFTYEVKVAADTITGEYDNTATADATEVDPKTAKTTVAVKVGEVLGETAEPALSVVKTVDAPFANPGDTVTYTVVVKNTGDATAENVILDDNLPAGLAFVQGGTDKRQWQLGDLEAGESVTIVYDVLVNKAVTNGKYDNVATAHADNVDPVEDKADIQVRQPAVLGEVLAETGVGVRDLAIFGLAAMFLTFSAAVLMRLTRQAE